MEIRGFVSRRFQDPPLDGLELQAAALGIVDGLSLWEWVPPVFVVSGGDDCRRCSQGFPIDVRIDRDGIIL